VQAVADAELLDVAELGVELGNGLPVGLAFQQSAIRCEPAGPGALDDLVFQEGKAAAVEPATPSASTRPKARSKSCGS